MKTRLKKGLLVILVVGSLLLTSLIAFSPYGSQRGFPYKAIVEEIEINAPPSAVYAYLGNSSNANKWSVFVDHIVPLNADEVPDGKPGSFRRCFQNKDETGMVWDEEITVADPAKRRQLTIFNLKNFPIRTDGLATEQLYDSFGTNKTRLRFTLFFKDVKPGLMDKLKMSVAAWEVSRIYRRNLQNIKANVEAIKSTQQGID